MTPPSHEGHHDKRYGRDTIEFARVANLSDAVFAIAMTLLVLTLDVTDVPLSDLGGALADEIPRLIAVVVTFAVVANFWWIHHRFFAVLGFLEPGLIVLNLVLVGAVALVPFPTSLIGRDPTARVAVLPYLALLAFIAVIHLLLLVRAGARQAWRSPLPDGLFRWLLAGWGSNSGVTVLALLVAVWLPAVGLVMLLLTWPAEAVVAWRAPGSYAAWG